MEVFYKNFWLGPVGVKATFSFVTSEGRPTILHHFLHSGTKESLELKRGDDVILFQGLHFLFMSSLFPNSLFDIE